MKKVILWGDSIRMGYCQAVADELKEVAHMSWPAGNCQSSTVMLTQWQNWLGDARPDVMHLNCGLHDVKTISLRNREPVVPVEFYRRNLEHIFDELRFTLPDARLIFATTTPVVERVTTNGKGTFNRFNADIEAANDAAREIAALYEIEINDLWAVVQWHGPEKMLNADGVHYDEANSRVLGQAVAQKIRAAV